jgi:hypothetical protein
MNAPAHPLNPRLALYAGGELGWRERIGIWMHLAGCQRCRRFVATTRALRDGLRKQAARFPQERGWPVLAAEMKANIHLGLAAGAIVADMETEGPETAPVPEAVGWRAAVVFSSLVVVAASGWYLHSIQPQTATVRGPAAVLLQAKSDGIELRQQNAAMTFLTPGQTSVRTDADVSGGVRARYVDPETGQVTISHVYADSQ